MTVRERQKLLTQRGIGKRYQTMSLTDYDHPHTDDLIKFVSEYDGQNVVFFGISKASYDLTVLTARALILSGSTDLHVVDFFDLCNEDTFENLQNKPLCILNYQPDDRFVNPQIYKKLESKLFALLDNGQSIVLHLPYNEEVQIPPQHNIMNQVLLQRLYERHVNVK